LSQMARQTGMEPEAQNVMVLGAAAHDSFLELFDRIMKFIFVFAGFCIAIVVCGLAWTAALRLRDGLVEWRRLGGRSEARWLTRIARRRRKEAADLMGTRLRAFRNPFAGPAGARDGNETVRYLWEAMTAWCADAGCPCPPDQTPREFVAGQPRPLAGFEARARFIADLFTYSEFSGQPLPASVMPELERFWTDLQAHAARGL
ncbi:MAG: DUF4129 domain-containing protein, partial [bacterium]|nr:DUF4129 domain-containing protein [bacterium]